MMESRKSARKDGFWRIYGIAVASAVLLVLVFLLVFFDIMKNYEMSQPISGAEAFAASLTDEKLSAMADAVLEAGISQYEDESQAEQRIRETLVRDSLVCAKDYANYTSEAPVFIVSAGETPVYRVTLRQGDKIGYGFTSWEVAESEEILTYEGLSVVTSHVYVPEGAELCVNGIPYSEEPTGEANYKHASVWESAGVLRSDYYKIKLVCEAELSVALDGLECRMLEEDGKIYFLYPSEQLRDYVVTAPTGATVKVNGITVTDEYITELDVPQYAVHKLEAERDGIPTKVSYLVKGLAKAPTVEAEMAGESLGVSFEGESITVAYPDSLLYSLEIRVPSGSAVSVGGVTLSTEDITETAAESAELFSYCTSIPSYDIYAIDGLFFEPAEVSVAYNGAPLASELVSDGNVRVCEALYPRITAPESEALALDFLKAYFFYTSNGYVNTSANLATVLGYIPYGCTLYRKMVQSEDGFSWTSPVASMNYDKLELTDVFEYPGNLRLCDIEFAVSQSFYGGIYRDYSGTMRILVTSAGQVVGMEIIADRNA